MFNEPQVNHETDPVSEVSLNMGNSHSPPSSHHSSHHSMAHREVPMNINDNNNKTLDNKMLDIYNKLSDKFPHWDVYIIFELLVFWLSFFVLLGDDIRGQAGLYLYQVNFLLLIDFFFRLLSIRIESFKRENWNTTLHCVLPLVLWLLASFQKFHDVFGSEPTQVLNTLIFTTVNFLVILVIVFKGIGFFKNKCESQSVNNSQPEPDDNLL